MAYDALHTQAVLFSGTTDAFAPNRQCFCNTDSRTWLWDGTTWSSVLPATSPSIRLDHMMAYDSVRHKVVLFGGISPDGKTIYNDTWLWDGTQWTLQTPATSPLPRSGGTMVFDELHGVMVLFGGAAFFGAASDTWVWDGTNWTNVTPVNSPPARGGAAMAYDGARQVVVLYGGSAPGFFNILGDTWTWDGSSWTQATPAAAPSARSSAVMAYDPGNQNTILFGGFDALNPQFAETWAWDGSNWTQLNPATVPPARENAVMVFESLHHQIMMFGGSIGGFGNDTWFFGGSSQTAVTINVPAGVQFAFNGNNYTGSQTLNIAPGTYTLSTPSPQAAGTGTQIAWVSWDDTGAQSHQVTVGASAVSITGTYKTQFSLTAGVSPLNGGNLSVTSGFYDQGTVLIVTENPAAGFVFSGWSGACTGTGPCSITMSAPMSVTATFTQVAYSVTIAVPAGVQFSFNGATYTGSASVTLPPGSYSLSTVSPQTPIAGEQATFQSWSDTGAQAHMVTVTSGPVTISGLFNIQFLLTTIASAGTGGTVSPPTGYFDQGSAVPVTASPAPGFVFAGWSGACTGTGPCSVSMTTVRTVTATFNPIAFNVTINVPAQVQFSLNGTVYTGTHTVALAPGSYPLSTPSPQLTAAGTQLRFDSWSDTGGQTHQINVTGAMTITGAFVRQYLLTLAAVPSSEGTVAALSPGPYYDNGATVFVAATPNPGFEFDFWAGDCSGSSLLCILSMAAPRLAEGQFRRKQNWAELFPSKSPQARDSSAMAYDAASKNVVLFGGTPGNGGLTGALNDTWVWDGTTWNLQHPILSPSARGGHTMAYDGTHVILFGGIDTTAAFPTDTWIWDPANNTWIRNNVPGPPGRTAASMAFDAARGVVVLFGGINQGGALGDTWVWNGKSWANVTPVVSPQVRFNAAMAYDPLRARTVLFGGALGVGANFELFDTWEWNGASWLQKLPLTFPSNVTSVANPMAYNRASREVLLLAAAADFSQSLTWTWDGTEWLQRMPLNIPPVRLGEVMVYDGARDEILMFGGQSSAGHMLNDTWVWNAASVGLSPQPPVVTKDGQGNYIVSIDLKNTGNVPDSAVIVNGLTLGSASDTTFKFIADIEPGASSTVQSKFKVSAVTGFVATITLQGTFSANGSAGIPWSGSFLVFLP
jgi:uncharacterized repeat protein (TIGR02543 family)